MSLIETPPSPIRLTLSATLCTLIAAALVWGWFGRIDVVAEAQGKFQPAGRVKAVQPMEAGRVAAIKAVNGVHVEAGDVLVELDAEEAKADADGARAGLAAYEAETARRKAALEGADSSDFAAPEIAWSDGVPGDIRAREARVLRGDLANLASTVGSLDAQAVQKEAEKTRLEATVKAQERLIGVDRERVDMRASLVAKGAGSKKDFLDADESMAYAQTQLETQKGQLAEAVANLKVIAGERRKAIGAFLSDNAQKLADAGRQADDFRQRLAKSEAKLEHSTLRSPVAGTVTASTLVSRGQVLGAGDEVMRVVPDGSSMEIECYLPNGDAGFVKPGQTAEIKVESFPFTRYGTIKAKVVRVARDAIPQPEAEQAEGSPTKSQKTGAFAGAQRVQNLVFQVVLAPETTTISADGSDVPLTAGMAVTAEVRTGSRRILEYVFSPIAEVGSEAMKER
jgi:hemolysin D